MTSPIIKWAGGKTQLLPELVRRMPDWHRTYFEPFAGGAALFFHLRPSFAFLNDVNVRLIDTYRAVRDHVSLVRPLLERHRVDHNEKHFYVTRKRLNANQYEGSAALKLSRRAADFVYLNKTAFNGLYRENQSGEFNVPMGRYTNPRICVPSDLLAASQALKGAHLSSLDFVAFARTVGPSDLAYFDSPYDPVSNTSSFTGYHSSPFGKLEQKMLALVAADLVDRGAFVMLSNSDTRFVRSLYPKSSGFRIDRVRAKRSINSSTTKRGSVNEVIITGGYAIPRSRRASQ